MTLPDLDLVPATTTATTAAAATTSAPAVRVPHRIFDFAIVVGAWALVVLVASVFPRADPQLGRAALFIHLVSMAVGFGSVVLVDVYGLLWLLGHRTLSEVIGLAAVAHTVIAVGVGGLLASGIALRPDLDTSVARFKMVLVLVLMLNGVAAQRALHRMRRTLPPDTRGANIPWAGFQRVLAAALISQSTWWGCIAIGFMTNANRHS
ncbi:MAG: hypothetical protein AB1679_17625 [Actinomycetota bacterium]|jgi:hypothetical protein